jgi:hypothetical protein
MCIECVTDVVCILELHCGRVLRMTVRGLLHPEVSFATGQGIMGTAAFLPTFKIQK